MILLITGLILFLGIHSVRIIAPGWRESQIAARGDGPWKGIYSVVSIIGLIVLIYGYSVARGSTVQIFDPPEWSRGLLMAAMPISLLLLMAADFRPGYIKKALRHPMLLGVLIWSGCHLLANGDSASLLLFGGFLVWAVIDLISVFNRPSVPAGPVVLWPDLASIGLALVLTWLIIRYLHEWLIGVPVV